MNTVFILTGGNIGRRLNNLEQALRGLQSISGLTINRSSSLYETAAWGMETQPSFYNQVIEGYTDLSPQRLLSSVLSIERDMGRVREMRNGPRIIDIDLLFYGVEILHSADLILPHPRMAERRFVLTPLAELAPDLIHPVLGKTVAELLHDCPDPLAVHKLAVQPAWAAAKFAPSL